jgi:hypothetical protein
MANRNGKGPQEKGPKTGRGLGKCEGEAQFQSGLRRGRNCGKGFGRGRCFVEAGEGAETEYLKTLKVEIETRLKELGE